MKKTTILLVALLLSCICYAQDTFSIIAVDPDTGEVGSAGASCVTGIGAQGIIDIITDIIPGKGGVNSQAFVCIPNTNLQNAIVRMQEGDSPSEIITWLMGNDACSSQNFDPAFRQYGIADLDDNNNPRTAGFSGVNTDDYKEDRQGANYSVQGNILLNQTVIDNMETNFTTTDGTLADKLMAALQGANFAGADSRCLAAGTSSTTAYLTVYAADDTPGNPTIRLNIGEQASGVEPIDLLQEAYDELLSVEENALALGIQIYPNPTAQDITFTKVSTIEIKHVTIYDVLGKIVKESKGENIDKISVFELTPAIYFAKVATNNATVTLRFIKK